jgi:hypothetical protein
VDECRPLANGVQMWVDTIINCTERKNTGFSGGGGRGLHSFPFQLNLSSSVHRMTQIDS